MKLKAKYGAVWQDLPSSPGTCPSQGASLCTYAAWFARPAHIQPKNIFRLPLSAGCVQTLLRIRMGCHKLLWDLGRRQGIGRLHRVCTLCAGDNLGDEQHVSLDAQGCKIFVTNIRGCLESMQLPCFNTCGKMILMVLRCLSRRA